MPVAGEAPQRTSVAPALIALSGRIGVMIPASCSTFSSNARSAMADRSEVPTSLSLLRSGELTDLTLPQCSLVRRFGQRPLECGAGGVPPDAEHDALQRACAGEVAAHLVYLDRRRL